jgi:hypothetical protein
MFGRRTKQNEMNDEPFSDPEISEGPDDFDSIRDEERKTREFMDRTNYVKLKKFIAIPTMPTNKMLHEDLRKFRAVTDEGVKQLEISLLSNGWTENFITDIRLFPLRNAVKKYIDNKWMEDPGPQLRFEEKKYRLVIEEGNHRHRALQNLYKYFFQVQNDEELELPPHLIPFKDMFEGHIYDFLPRYIACIKTDIKDIKPGYNRKHEREHMEKSLVIPYTVYQSFKIMARDYDEWSKTHTKKRTFDSFVLENRYHNNKRNRLLFGFLFLREDEELMAKWEEDDTLEYNRVRTNNFLKTTYPGKSMVEKNKWRKEHLRQMLNLPKDEIIETSETASKLIKLLSGGKIKDYTEDVKAANDTASKKDNKVSLKGTSITDDIKAVLQRQFPEKTLAEVVVKFA